MQQLREAKAETGLSGTGPQFWRAGGRAGLCGADGQSHRSSGDPAMGPAGPAGLQGEGLWCGTGRAELRMALRFELELQTGKEKSHITISVDAEKAFTNV